MGNRRGIGRLLLTMHSLLISAPIASHNVERACGYAARSADCPPQTLAFSITARPTQVLLSVDHSKAWQSAGSKNRDILRFQVNLVYGCVRGGRFRGSVAGLFGLSGSSSLFRSLNQINERNQTNQMNQLNQIPAIRREMGAGKTNPHSSNELWPGGSARCLSVCRCGSVGITSFSERQVRQSSGDGC